MEVFWTTKTLGSTEIMLCDSLCLCAFVVTGLKIEKLSQEVVYLNA